MTNVTEYRGKLQAKIDDAHKAAHEATDDLLDGYISLAEHNSLVEEADD